MKQLRKYVVGMLLLAVMMFTAACGSTDNKTDNGIPFMLTTSCLIRMEMEFTTIRMWTGTGFWKKSAETPMTWWMTW